MIEHMFDARAIAAHLERVLAELDPAALDGDATLELTDWLDRIERLAASGKALLSARIDDTGAWRGAGARDAVGFLAGRTRCSRRRVRDGLAATAQLGSMPLVDRALRAGDLTIDQAADIVAAVAEHPETEVELVSLAGTATARQLKDRCVQILAQGDGAEEQHRRAKAERSASSSVGRDGTWRLSAQLPVIDGAFVDKALDHFQTKIFDEARRRGDREPFDAYRADAVVAMATAAMGEGCHGACAAAPGEAAADGSNNRSTRRRRRGHSSSIRHAIVITVPHTAFRTSAPAAGETCEVPGVGPVPVSEVHRLMDDDPIIKAVVTKGRDITAVATLTRTIKEDLRLAVLAANDLRCAVANCDNMRFLQLDHEHEFHKGGPTSYPNLRPLCTFHHRQRTTDGFELRGSPGSYEWIAPDGTVLAAERSAVPA